MLTLVVAVVVVLELVVLAEVIIGGGILLVIGQQGCGDFFVFAEYSEISQVKNSSMYEREKNLSIDDDDEDRHYTALNDFFCYCK